MPVKVDQDKCIGCGLCPSLMPNVFFIDQEIGKAKVRKQPKKINQNLKSTAENCPVSAILIEKNE